MIYRQNFKDHFKSNSFEKRKEQLSSKDQLVIYAAKIDSDLIGYCVVSVNDNIGEIDSLYVKTDQREHNIGKSLVSSAMQWLEEQDCSQINVEVAYGNEAALPFYERFGFRKRFHVLQIKNT